MKQMILVLTVSILVVLVSCRKEQEPNYSQRMLQITEKPWRWITYRMQENGGDWIESDLDACILDNYYTFEPYDGPSNGNMTIDYGCNLCFPIESEGWKAYDYWGFYSNENKMRASGWGGTEEPGEILQLDNSTLKILFERGDTLSIELTLVH